MSGLKNPKNPISFDELQDILENGTITSAFFYSKSLCHAYAYTLSQRQYKTLLKCYSNSGILLPIKAKQTNEQYDFKNVPKYFYFRIIQNLNMSQEFQNQYYQTLSNIRYCNGEKIVKKFLPLINKTFIVGNPEIPKFLSHKYKVIASSIGEGFYYDYYSKSIPFLTYKSKLNLDVDPTFDFNQLWGGKWFKSYGKCDILNPKPKPITEEKPVISNDNNDNDDL